eukprot:TRINITY_DN4925_c0_g1_i2.p2 TRINITY_DN4925_c0_g1~~TRINITY_DN4925_c0_g1_i2.p2  ORF type:complete len:296 (-),score=49.00 TRINITY_DN4925_c0_g1_i2:136-1023(-)
MQHTHTTENNLANMVGYTNVQQQLLQKTSLKLKERWLQGRWTQEYELLSIDQQQDIVLGWVLSVDLRDCCERGTFWNVNSEDQHRRFVEGLFIMQIQQVVNIHAPYKSRYMENDNKRCLKLLLCDRQRQFVGIEHQRCPQLGVNMTAGIKILLTNPQITGNKIFLRPQSMHVLGGRVEVLEQTRQRVFDAWQKPLNFGKNVGNDEKYQIAMQRLADAARQHVGQQVAEQETNHVAEEIDDFDFMLQFEQGGGGGLEGLEEENQTLENANEDQDLENQENIEPIDDVQQQRRQSLD